MRSRLNIQGRAALGFMADEMSQAIADADLPFAVTSSNDITFCTFRNASAITGSVKQIKRVRYYLDATNHLVKRAETELLPGSGYPPAEGTTHEATLATNVDSLVFALQPNTYTTLPPRMDIKITLRKQEETLRVRAGSAGPNGVWNDYDDVWTTTNGF